MTPAPQRYLFISVFITTLIFTAPISTLVLSGCGASVNLPQNTGAVPTVAAVATQVDGTAPNRKQEVQFSEPMDQATISTQSFQVSDSAGNKMPGSVTYDSDFETASFQPTPALQSGVTYTATITTAAASAGGVHLAGAYSYQFTTRASTDTSPLMVNSVSPAANSSCVSATTLIIVTFDEVPDASTVTATNFEVTGPSGTIPVKLSTNVTTTQVVLTPASALPSGTITVTVSNVGDLADVMMKAPYSWSFSTACPGGGGGSATTQYQSPLFSESALDTVMNGQVTVDTSGNTTIALTGAGPSATYTVQFCAAFDVASTFTPLPCFNVATVSTDSTGTGTATVKFPQTGNWAGDFYLNDSTGKAIYQTYLAPALSNQTYLSTLVPMTSANNGTVTTFSPQSPLTSGTVTYSNGSLVFTVSGASLSTTYFTNESETNYIDSSGTYALSTIVTNAMGNGSSTTTLNFGGGDMFQVGPQNSSGQVDGAGFIGGFSVP